MDHSLKIGNSNYINQVYENLTEKMLKVSIDWYQMRQIDCLEMRPTQPDLRWDPIRVWRWDLRWIDCSECAAYQYCICLTFIECILMNHPFSEMSLQHKFLVIQSFLPIWGWPEDIGDRPAWWPGCCGSGPASPGGWGRSGTRNPAPETWTSSRHWRCAPIGTLTRSDPRSSEVEVA